MQVVSLFMDIFFYEGIGIANAVYDVPAGDAWFYRDKGQGDISKMPAGTGDQLLEEDQYFFGMSSVAQVIIAGIYDDGFRAIGCQQSFEEPHTGCQRRAAKTQVD